MKMDLENVCYSKIPFMIHLSQCVEEMHIIYATPPTHKNLSICTHYWSTWWSILYHLKKKWNLKPEFQTLYISKSERAAVAWNLIACILFFIVTGGGPWNKYLE